MRPGCAVVLLIVLGGVAACGEEQPEATTGPTDTEYVEYHDGTPTTNGLPNPGGALFEVSGRAARLVEDRDDDFAGLYFDDGPTMVIVATTDAGEALATRTFADRSDVIVERGEVSLAGASRLQDSLFEASSAVVDKILFSNLDPVTSAVQVTVRAALDDDETMQIEQLAAKAETHIDVYVNTEADGGQLD